MAQNFRRIVDGIQLVAKTSSTVDTVGDIDYNTTNSKLTLFNGIADPIVTEADVATLTNKSIDAGSNTITNLTNSNLNGSAGITGANIATNTVANSNLAQMGSFTIKGNDTGGTANAADLTGTQVTSMLNVFSSSLQGLVPASGGGTINFLRADGTFTTPPGSSGVETVGTIDSQAPSSNGLVIGGTVIYAQSASTTNPGMVNTLSQSFTGNKTFISQVSTPLLTDNGTGITIEGSNNQNVILTTFAAGRLQLTGGEGVDFKQISTPAQPAATYDTLYFKSDNNLYSLNTTGKELAISPTHSYWSGYHDGGNYWSTSSSSFVDPTSGGSTPSLTTRFSNNITVITGASDVAGITFTPTSSSAVYQISAIMSDCVNGNPNQSTFYKITDGTTDVCSISKLEPTSTSFTVISLSGIYAVSSSSPVTLKIQLKVDGGVGYINYLGNGANSIEWSLIQIV